MTYGMRIYSKAVETEHRQMKFRADAYTGEPYTVEEDLDWMFYCAPPFFQGGFYQNKIQSPRPYLGDWPAWWLNCAGQSGVLQAIRDDPRVIHYTTTGSYPVFVDPITGSVKSSAIVYVDEWEGGKIDISDIYDDGPLFRGGKPIFTTEQTGWRVIDAVSTTIPTHPNFYQKDYSGYGYSQLRITWQSPLRGARANFLFDKTLFENSKIVKLQHRTSFFNHLNEQVLVCRQPGHIGFIIWGYKS